MAELDAIDRRIVDILVRDGRISFARLGEAVSLSPHGAADRVRRLIARGVITSFTAVVDQGRMGRGLDAMVDVRLLPSTDPGDFERRIAEIPATREVSFVTGRSDYVVRVSCVDTDDLDGTVRAIRQAAGTAQTETRIVMRSTRAL